MENNTEDKEIMIETHSIERGTFRLMKMNDGTKIKVGSNSLDFYERLLELKPEYKIQLMGIDDEFLESYLASSRDQNILVFKDFLSKKWFWRETSEPYRFQDTEVNSDLINLPLTKTQILSKLKTNKISPLVVSNAVRWFQNQEELFLKD